MSRNEARAQWRGERRTIAIRQRRRRSVRPAVLALETRSLMSTFTVTSTADDGGAGTLRYELGLANAASGANTIVFDSGVFAAARTIQLTGGPLELSNTTGTETIVGPAAGLTITAGGQGQDFLVDPDVNASISGLTITGASVGGPGGGLMNNGTVTLTDCTITGNTAANGGGVYTSWYGTTYLYGSAVTNNVATGNGGGIYDTGSMTLGNCVVSGNSAAGNGGGVYSILGGLTMTGVVVGGNNATNGGGLGILFGTSTLTDCSFTGDVAATSGGGLYSNGGTTTLTDCSFTGDLAAWNGGGLDNTASGTVTLTGGTFSGNSAGWNGGALYTYGTTTLSDCTISGNTAGAGGGLYGYKSTSTLTGVTVSSNVADDGAGVAGYRGTTTLTNCLVTGNIATGEGGGLLNTSGTADLVDTVVSGNTAGTSGGLGTYAFGTSALTNSTVSGNTATGTGGGVGNNDSVTTLLNSTVSGNSAMTGGGVNTVNNGLTTVTDSTVSGNTAQADGGGLYIASGGTTQMIGVTVAANSASSGGGLDNAGGTVTLGNTIVAANASSTTGPDAIGTVASLGNNLVGETNGSSGWVSSDLTGTVAQPLNALLAPLGSYGGPTATMALLPGSPAINGGNNALIPNGVTTDQRGMARIIGGTVDIGAFESHLFTIAATSGSGQSTAILTAFPAPLVATVTANYSLEPVAGGLVTFTPPQAGPSSALAGNPATIAANGTVTVAATANDNVGLYTVPAGANGITNTADFTLINQAVPTITTTPNVSAVTLGTSPVTLKDTATLANGYYETGTITFTLYLGDTLLDTETVSVDGDGQYTTPTGYTLPAIGTVTGTYQWDATYTGDTFNLPATENDATAERTVVSPANPSIVTTSSAPAVTLGPASVTLTDTATLSGGYHEGGSITFNLYLGNTLVDTESVSVNGDGIYTTPTGYTLPTGGTVTGTYQWDASYSGDANNNPSSESNATAEQTVVSPASPSIVTTSSAAALTLGTTAPTLTDKATLSGGYYEGGSITFDLYLGDTLVDTESVAVDGDGTYATPTGYTLPTTGTVVGTYQWDASYSGDANNNPSSESNATAEQTVVNPASPSIVTTSSAASLTLGTTAPTLTDSAVLSGGYFETGTITFNLYLGSTLVDTESVAVDGNGTYATPTGYTLPTTGTVVGTYQWDASFTGDSNNNSASESDATAEQTVVNAASPTIVTTSSAASLTLGTTAPTLTDTATLSGGYYEGGSITFTLYLGNTLVDTESVPVNGNGTYTTPTGYTLPTAGTVTGTYQWDATYSGDSNNNAASESNAAAEQTVVNAASPTIVTTSGVSAMSLGTSSPTLKDTAFLSGGYYETGTITFTLYLGNTLVDTESIAVNGNGTYTAPVGYTLPTTGTVTGTYQWDATYNGDTNNNVALDPGEVVEQTAINPARPTITTTSSTATLTLGTSSPTLMDTATLSGGYHEGGSITFTLYLGNTLVDTESVSVNGNGTYTTPTGYTLPTTGTVVGTYQWDASYSGDSNNNSTAESDATAEQTVVNPASPSIVTTSSAASLTLGTTAPILKDTATLSGGYFETGTLTFTLYLGSTAVDTETVSVHGNGTYATPTGYTPPTTGAAVTGTYQWDASFTGDTNNASASEANAPAERTTVVAASPSIVTTPSTPAMSLGTTAPTLKDTAVLAGGYYETGTITFTLVGPGGSTLDTETVSVTGNGSYTTPTGYTLPTTGTVIGTYQWNASYSGDVNDATVSESGLSTEQTAISAATPGIVTTPSPASMTLSSATPGPLNDSAAFAGGYYPTGTLTFTLTYNGSVVYTDHVAVDGNGTYSTTAGDNSGGYSLPSTGTVVGTYQWNATYSGDANDTKATDQGGTSEQATVNPASPTIVTTPGGTVSMAGFTISGVKYLDATGDGFSADDTPEGGVTIDLYQVVNGSQTLVGSTVTASNGTYSFTGYSPGTYDVEESVPSGYIQTGGGPNGDAGDAYYTINASAGHNYTGNNFDDYLIPDNTCTSFVFKVGSGCSTTSVSSLSGHTAQGDTVSVALPSGSSQVYTLVVYTAPSPSFSDSNAYQQTIYQVSSGTYSSATNHTLSVTIPNCYYQIDFVCGQAIGQLEPNQNNDAYGPDSAEILYHAQSRLITSDNAGCTAPNPMPTGHPATPPSPVSVPTSASTLTDTAVLSGGYRPGGTITFYLFAPGVTPNSSYSNNVYSDTVTVNGNGNYSTATGTNPGGYVPTGSGTYQWVAVYSGDPNNNAAADAFGAEPESVNATSPTISSTPGGAVTLGGMSKLTDTATLSGGYNPTGTITFYLFAPGITPNSTYSNNVYADAVTVNGDGTYSTSSGGNAGGYTPTATGTFQWVAVYSGDSSNSGVAGAFGAEPETVDASSPVSTGQYGTCGFWQNPNGQATIQSFNGCSTSTQLGNWLACNFPNLFGCKNTYTSSVGCGSAGLAGLTNAQVASIYKSLSSAGSTAKSTYVQAFAAALGIYADTAPFGGNATAQGFGFCVTPAGGSGSTYNVGSNGSAFGVSNNTRLSVYQVLQTLNSNFSPSSGCFYGNNQGLTNCAYNVVNGINTSGDVTNGVALPASSGVADTPAQIRDAYGINSLSSDGTGETIAIVDAYNDPDIFQAVNDFDSQFSLTDSGPTIYSQYGDASNFLTVLNQSGQADALPSVDPNGPGTANWEMEEALDVEWVHAIAPGAQIVLVEANSQSLSDLMAAAGTAAAQPGVSVVSMSWGFTEGQSVFGADEASYDNVFNVPGVTFLASTGDYGSADPEYPAFSPDVVAVGGTSLTLNADNSYNSETGWGGYSDAAGTMIGSGGGISQYETEPSFQEGVQSTGYRTTPDVSTVADPNTGAWVADPYNLDPSNPFEAVGGTSLSAPIWAGLVAMVNQGRAAAGEAALNSSGPSETLQALYSLPQSDYNSITSGSNGYTANAGYNLVTGLGTPIAGSLVPDMVAYNGPGTTYSGPTVGPLQDATLSGSWTPGGDTENVFSVFDAMPAGHFGFATQDHGMVTTDAAGPMASSQDGPVSTADAVSNAAAPQAQPTPPSLVGSAATGSDGEPIGVVPTSDTQAAHDAVITGWSSSQNRAAARPFQVIIPGVTVASRTSVLQGDLVDSALEGFDTSLLGAGDQAGLGRHGKPGRWGM